MANKFTQKAQNTLNRALEEAHRMGHTYVGSEHILLGLLTEKDSASAKLLAARGADAEKIRKRIIEISGTGTKSNVSAADMTPRTKKIIEASAYESVRNANNYIGTEHILYALLCEKDCVGVKILESVGVSVSDLKGDLYNYMGLSADKGRGNQEGRKSDESKRIGGAPMLSNYGRDLTQLAKNGKIDPIIGRDEETQRVIRILSRRTKNNPCLVGEPGVGKTAVVEGLAQLIADGNVPELLKDKRIITLDIPSMIAGAKYRGEFEERMKGVMDEASKNPDIILFIDEIHMIIGAGAAEGAVDAANILKPSLARGELRVIGATTISEYRLRIEKDAALERRFQAVNIGEPSESEARMILLGLRDKYEAHHKLKISDEAIDAAVRLSVRYIPDKFLPDKAIDLIDEAASKLRIEAHTSPAGLKEAEGRLNALTHEKEEAITAQNFELAALLRDEELAAKKEYDDIYDKWKNIREGDSLCVGESDIADIVTYRTGIPVNKLVEEESEKLLAILRRTLSGDQPPLPRLRAAAPANRFREEHRLHRHTEAPGDADSRLQRRVEASLFNGDDRLAGDARRRCQLLLPHIPFAPQLSHSVPHTTTPYHSRYPPVCRPPGDTAARPRRKTSDSWDRRSRPTPAGSHSSPRCCNSPQASADRRFLYGSHTARCAGAPSG